MLLRGRAPAAAAEGAAGLAAVPLAPAAVVGMVRRGGSTRALPVKIMVVLLLRGEGSRGKGQLSGACLGKVFVGEPRCGLGVVEMGFRLM
jgi:hypothetical protein